ncbi:class I SAM-dependent methyltransferase [Cytophaga aurantiaca]|uniref:class I SAM-dependent methyltransferase n=1 Tax=Cytophaga aurantiaca TaxID=29530 RepID=UPI00037A27CD|nr:class I SAM-dependent methyltransferase [Cytophaga aurantiaca]
MIEIIDPVTKESLFEHAEGLTNSKGKLVYKLSEGAYRVVSDDNYTSNFGLEWNTFQKTQIDKFSGNNVSEERFFAQTRWAKNSLEGETLLEVGSGAGRFSQIILDHTKASLYSVDYSNAVEANYRNNGPHERLKLFQASIYDLPFKKESFDKVICLGVLQHTPDFKASVKALTEMVKPGGELVIDFYPIKNIFTKVHSKYILRPFLKRMKHERLMSWIRNNIDTLISIYKFNRRIGLGFLNRFVPICEIERTLPAGIAPDQLREWIILDTFDMFSPEYDQPQRLSTVAAWVKEFGMIDVDAAWVTYHGNLEAPTVRARKEL